MGVFILILGSIIGVIAIINGLTLYVLSIKFDDPNNLLRPKK